MQDNGEVLPGLNETWTFMGANAIEWACGMAVFLIISLFADTPVKAAPFMLTGWVFTTTSLASLRKSFPDEQRGVRNAIATACGFPPPGIPKPASLQPVWSAAPVRELREECRFRKLGLESLFTSQEADFLVSDEDII